MYFVSRVRKHVLLLRASRRHLGNESNALVRVGKQRFQRYSDLNR
jgi:hypothetical protein